MSTNPPIRSALALLAALLLAACGKDAASPVAATLAAAPQSIEFSDSTPAGSLFLTATPSGGRLEWRVAAKPDWITLDPASGVVKGVQEVKVTAAGLATLPPGVRTGTIELISDGGAASVQVVARVSANPIATASVTQVVVPATGDTAAFDLANSGRGTLSWSISTSRTELKVLPSSGTLEQGKQAKIRVVADKRPLAAGETEASLTITAAGTGRTVTLPIKVQVAATPSAALSLGRLGFSQSAGSRSFWLRNTGKGMLTWSAEAGQPWLSLSPQSGQVGAGDSVKVTGTVNRSGVQGGEGTTVVTISTNAASGALQLPVVVTAGSGFEAGLQVLDHRVIDAEYSPRAELIVTVSANPSRLSILDALTGTVSHVGLSLPPTSVSIRPDGAFAAVGHNGFISYVDLAKRSVVRTYAVTTDALDVVLAGNGWVYVFPRTDQWETIRSINLATGVETTSGGWSIYAGTLGKLHPSGEYMYGADNGLSPSDFEKYDIGEGTARVLYDSPYHGDFAFGGNLWISRDGTRLFARSGNVFRSSPVRSEDMLYAGKLAGVSGVRGVDDLRSRDRVVVLPEAGYGAPPATDVRVYDWGFLAFKGTVPLPKFPGGTASHGQFVFASGGGERVYVLVQAAAAGGLAQDWAIVTLDAAQLP